MDTPLFSVASKNLDEHPNSKLFTITNNTNGFQVVLASYGATVMSIKQPDRRNIVEEVTLCYPTVEELKTKPGSYFGCIAGRVANRIRNGKYSIDGSSNQAAINNGPNSLHGGVEGFDKKYWNAEITKNTMNNDDDNSNSNNNDSANASVSIRFSYTSVDGEEGYPGTVQVNVTYIISSSTAAIASSNKITILYHATVIDKPTIINLTNHTYFNLSGNYKRKIDTHRLRLWCRKYLPVDAHQIPTGQLLDVYDTYFDFTFSAYAIVSESAREIMMMSSSNNNNNSLEESAAVNNSSTESSGSFLMSPRALGRLLHDVIEHVDGGGKPGLDHCFVVDGYDSSNNNSSNTMSVIEDSATTASQQQFSPLSAKAIQLEIPSSSPHHHHHQLQSQSEPPSSLPASAVATTSTPTKKTITMTLRPVACLTDEVSGRRLTVHSTQPGVQVYTANHWLPAPPPVFATPPMTNLSQLRSLSSNSSGIPHPPLTQSQEMTVESLLSPILHSISGIFSQSNATASSGSRNSTPNSSHHSGINTSSSTAATTKTSPSPLLFPYIQQHNAICLETQDFPDAINQSPLLFPSIVLRPGETYQHATTWTFDVI